MRCEAERDQERAGRQRNEPHWKGNKKKAKKKNARALELSSGCWQDGVVESRAGIAKSRRNETIEGPKEGGTKKMVV